MLKKVLYHDTEVLMKAGCERHQGLVSNGAFDDFETFTKLSEKCKGFKINDNELIVDTTDFF